MEIGPRSPPSTPTKALNTTCDTSNESSNLYATPQRKSLAENEASGDLEHVELSDDSEDLESPYGASIPSVVEFTLIQNHYDRRI